MSKKSVKVVMPAAIAAAAPKTTAQQRRKAKLAMPAVIVTATPANKTSQLLTLLKREQGATLGELQSVSQWQAHSIRGFLSATVRKKMSLPLVSECRPTGERVYRIADAMHA